MRQHSSEEEMARSRPIITGIDDVSLPSAGFSGMETASLSPGTLFADVYEILAHLNSGGNGIIYAAIDRRERSFVALKLPRTRDRLIARACVLRESAFTTRLSGHPFIAKIHEIGEADGKPYLVTHLIGTHLLTLNAWHWARKNLSTRKLIDIVIELLIVLKHIHLRGIIHCDLSPGNILIDENGRVSIIDLGSANLDRDILDCLSPEDPLRIYINSIEANRTDGFTAPDWNGSSLPNRNVDIYSVGAIMFYLLTRRKFTISSLWSEIPDRLRPMLERALQIDSANRYSDADAFLSDLLDVRSEYDLNAIDQQSWQEQFVLNRFGGNVRITAGGIDIRTLGSEKTIRIPIESLRLVYVSSLLYGREERFCIWFIGARRFDRTSDIESLVRIEVDDHRIDEAGALLYRLMPSVIKSELDIGDIEALPPRICQRHGAGWTNHRFEFYRPFLGPLSRTVSLSIACQDGCLNAYKRGIVLSELASKANVAILIACIFMLFFPVSFKKIFLAIIYAICFPAFAIVPIFRCKIFAHLLTREHVKFLGSHSITHVNRSINSRIIFWLERFFGRLEPFYIDGVRTLQPERQRSYFVRIIYENLGSRILIYFNVAAWIVSTSLVFQREGMAAWPVIFAGPMLWVLVFVVLFAFHQPLSFLCKFLFKREPALCLFLFGAAVSAGVFGYIILRL